MREPLHIRRACKTNAALSRCHISRHSSQSEERECHNANTDGGHGDCAMIRPMSSSLTRASVLIVIAVLTVVLSVPANAQDSVLDSTPEPRPPGPTWKGAI